MKLIVIAAVAENGCIGKEGKIPWYFSEDLRHFKNVTLGHTVVMGRKTFDSIGNQPLPGRKNVVLSSSLSSHSHSHSDLKIVDSFSDILKLDGDIYVCGGSRLYEEALPIANEIIISHIPGEYEGDTFFPMWPLNPLWQEFSRRDGEKKNGIVYKIYRNDEVKPGNPKV